jgi:hypothetical protein
MARTSVATDNFNRASLGSNWQGLYTWDGNLTIQSSTLVRGSGTANPARWNGSGTFSDNQYSSATIVTFGGVDTSNYYLGCICRASGDVDSSATNTRDFYEFIVQDVSARRIELAKTVNGTRTILAFSATSSFANGDIISMEVEGTTLRGYRNGVLILSATDSDLTTGKPGLIGSDGTTMDDWDGGDVTASTTPTITDAGDEQYFSGETGIVITGTNFGAAQGSNGRVYLSPTDDVDDVGRVSQTITAWSATSITFTATLGSLSLDTNLYLFVLADSLESNAAGHVVQIVARPFIRDTLIGLGGSAVASETGITMLVYHSVPATAVAPAQVITGVSTNGSGQLNQVINRGALALNAPVWMILMKDGVTAQATARKVTPVYE